MLYSIGDQELCIGELRTRGYYLGANVTYNLKKLLGVGPLEHQPSRVAGAHTTCRTTPIGASGLHNINDLWP